MNCFEEYLVKLLQKNIIYDNQIVPVSRDFSNAPSVPVLTLDLSGGVTTDYFYHEFEEQETVWQRCTSHINLNLWCNTEEERENITEQIVGAYIDEIENHCKYCSQYDDGMCKSLNAPCPSRRGGSNGKFHCDDPFEYGYESLSERCYVIPDTIRIEAPFFLDETDKHPPLLRSVFKCSADYEEPVKHYGTTYNGGLKYDLKEREDTNLVQIRK